MKNKKIDKNYLKICIKNFGSWVKIKVAIFSYFHSSFYAYFMLGEVK